MTSFRKHVIHERGGPDDILDMSINQQDLNRVIDTGLISQPMTTITMKEKPLDLNETNSNCISESTLISFDELLKALGEIGLRSDSSARRDELIERLETTSSSKIMFSDFIKCVKDVYRSDFTDRDDSGPDSLVEENRKLAYKNDILKKENESLKHKMQVLEKSCLKCEDDTTRLRKELQLQIENVRNLTGCCSPDAESKDFDDHRTIFNRPKNVVESNSHFKTTDHDSKVGDLRIIEDYRTVALEMLHFIEKLNLTLSKLEPKSRKSNLCRISSCTAAPIKCTVNPRSVAVVTRAATVNTLSTDASSAGRGPPRYVRGQRQSHLDRCALLKKLAEDTEMIVATVKPILEGDKGASGRELLAIPPCLNRPISVDSSQSVARAIGKLHRNIPSTAVVTIMTRV